MNIFHNASDMPGVITNLALTSAGMQSLAPCPGCRTRANLFLRNTHTPSYWIECDLCGLELHRSANWKNDTMPAHRRNARAMVDHWNTLFGDVVDFGVVMNVLEENTSLDYDQRQHVLDTLREHNRAPNLDEAPAFKG